jgi:3',5'-nucleoside bisphosphate phosphatase
MRVDLHVHSTASDGVYSPVEVVQIALTHQLNVIALTDHDTISGVLPAQQAAASASLEVLVGVELSSEDDEADRHILGYLVDLENEPLLAVLSELQAARTNRADLIMDKLDALGVKVSRQRVYALAGTGSIGRPHIAQAMVEQGFATSISNAFEKYIGDDCPAYVPHSRLEPARAIELIHGAGGVAVLAHPGHYEDYRGIISTLVPLGLDGIEVYYYDHSPKIVEDLRVVARQHDLLATVGSDFHRREADGSARLGSVKTPPDLNLVDALRERAARYR